MKLAKKLRLVNCYNELEKKKKKSYLNYVYFIIN